MAANSLHHAKDYLGEFFRRIGKASGIRKPVPCGGSLDAGAFMGSNRTQKPTCLLAEPLVSDRVAVLHKNVLRTRAEVAASGLPALQAGRLVAFEMRIEPAEE
jgi:hypothetical protein